MRKDMEFSLLINQLGELGLNQAATHKLVKEIETLTNQSKTKAHAWQLISKNLLSDYPFKIHLLIFNQLFPNWQKNLETAIAIVPTEEVIESANITHFMKKLNYAELSKFHEWSYTNYETFWQQMVSTLNIVFQKPYTQVCDLENGMTSPKWFAHGKLNITESCFNANANKTALIYANHKHEICQVSYGELNDLANRIASALTQLGYRVGDSIGIIMPMTVEAIAIYLGIIKMGGIVVSIADSFSSHEIGARLKISKTKAVFTQAFIRWGGKVRPLYEKVKKSNQELDTQKIITIVIPFDENDEVKTYGQLALNDEDIIWETFLTKAENDKFTAIPCDPMAPSHLLFSSGTTGEPKAVIWNHTTAIKAASDAFFHQNIKHGDVLCWPTNLGWMMGPWLIFAAFINQASIALYGDAPKDREFGEFIQNANVTMLGVVPTLVASWRQSQCMEQLNWEKIKVFSSTGECSNPEDMLYLMSLAHYKPVIEYCGGTEIGGAYVSSTVVQNNIPTLFSTATMGLQFLIINDEGNLSDVGEVAIVPPSIGLSTALWNANHDQIYFKDMPKSPSGKPLRRHGDQIKRFANGYYSLLGRIDDTMNLGGIKISATEIERTVSNIPGVFEVAAIAYQPQEKGRSELVIYVTTTNPLDKFKLKDQMQKNINERLNPLFKIHDIVIVNELPKTASNKIMRRLLRAQYQATST